MRFSVVLFTGSLAVLEIEVFNNEIKMYPLSTNLCNILCPFKRYAKQTPSQMQ
jgi:hypothetical protein